MKTVIVKLLREVVEILVHEVLEEIRDDIKQRKERNNGVS